MRWGPFIHMNVAICIIHIYIYLYLYIHTYLHTLSIHIYVNRHPFRKTMPSKFAPASMYCARVFDHYKERRSWQLQCRSGWKNQTFSCRLKLTLIWENTLNSCCQIHDFQTNCNPSKIHSSIVTFVYSSFKKHIWFPESIIPFIASCFPVFPTPTLLFHSTKPEKSRQITTTSKATWRQGG